MDYIQPIKIKSELVTLAQLNSFGTTKNLPSEFRLFKYGVNETVKGPSIFDEESSSQVIATYKAYGNDLSIDYEHQTIFPVSNGPVPAAGWFQLSIKNDDNGKPELWATEVSWTDRAKELLSNREYRYYSPTFYTNQEGKVMEIVNCALTNQPATLDMTPLVASKGVNTMDKMDQCLALLQQLVEKVNLIQVELEQREDEKGEQESPEEETQEEAKAVTEKDEEIEAMKKEISTLSTKLAHSEDETLKATLLAYGLPSANEKRVNDVATLVKLHRGEKTIQEAVQDFAKDNADLFKVATETKAAPKNALKALSRPPIAAEPNKDEAKKSFNERRQLNRNV